jgi:hypothetical protein
VLLQKVAKDIPFIAGSLFKFREEFGKKKGAVAKATTLIYCGIDSYWSQVSETQRFATSLKKVPPFQ